MNATLEMKFILTYGSEDPTWTSFACSVPGYDTAWFASQDARDTYARAMSQKTGLQIKSRYLGQPAPSAN